MQRVQRLVLILALVAPAAAALPPEAKEAFRRAEVAVEHEDWDLAIKYFEAARKASPTSAEILLRLALAHAEADGRELPALALFRAYLAAARDDPTAEDMCKRVEDKIIELEVRVEANIGSFVKKSKEAMPILPKGVDKTYTHHQLIRAQALSGDFVGAQDTADQMVDQLKGVSSTEASWAKMTLPTGFIFIAERMARTGDLAGARKLIPKIPGGGLQTPEFEVDQAYEQITAALAEIGDLSGAERTAAKIKMMSLQNMACAHLADAMIEAGKLDDAKLLLSLLPLDVRKYVHYTGMTKALRKLAIAQAIAGDLNDANDTLSKIDPFNEDYDYCLALCHIALAKAKKEDFSGARASIDQALQRAKSGNLRGDGKYLIWKDIKVAGDLIASMGASFTVSVTFSQEREGYLNALYHRDKALWHGDSALAEIHDWSVCALYMPDLIGKGAYGNSHADECLSRLSALERLNTYVQSVEPGEVAYCLAFSAKSMARASDHMRERKQYWKTPGNR
jgi:thioredoxin-like negative regulator of GroEL